MTKQELYLALYQATSTADAMPNIHGVDDFDRPLAVHLARNSNGNLSYITMEFAGVRSRFLCSLIFDGNGDLGTGFSNFSMPKVKLNPRQRSIALLACLEFLIHNKLIDADFNYYAERVTVEHQTGRNGFMEHYRMIRGYSTAYIHDRPELLRGQPYEDLSQSFSF